jgi:hypothetical protein
VAGFVYFSRSRTKRTNYQLEYTLNGAKVVLALSRSNQEGKKAQ